ncbi:histidine kinase [Paraflavitalea sp. CAU 1676]|uniref:sensor histidine kinase n=1 Tax=Paraflavitalea sp. CAU 1676 TaxID=3032598 RepID=UPI0023DBBAA6|nr:histidine kinase [Paraflavitalea sp. CAU 1676]MDF2188406.1 histidine kinase [Paraflavitalea sp. CAU 1676]
MAWKLPQYSGKDYFVLALCVAPFAVIINALMLGTRYFTDYRILLTATPLAAADFSIGFVLCCIIGVWLRRQYKQEEGISHRMLVMIALFMVMTVIFLFMLFKVYEQIALYQYHFDLTDFVWACIGTGIFVIFITFVLEGIARYEIWKLKMEENEQLSRASTQNRLQSLKSQVNPHFLFNSLNSLSSLIDEDEDKAEKFLDEMSKVYRYMLRNEEGEMVTLSAELRFINSYYYLLKTRYGDGLQIVVDAGNEQLHQWLPPLTLQTIVENAFTQNVMTRQHPLRIDITTTNNTVIVRNNVQPKLRTNEHDTETGIDNLVTRYQLLHQAQIDITDNDQERIIRLPLFDHQQEVPL